MEKNDLLVAVHVDEKGDCDGVSKVVTLTQSSFNELKQQASRHHDIKDKEKQELINRVDKIDKRLSKQEMLNLLLAKSIYDNFVDRGLIENNEQFQNDYFNFFMNDVPFSVQNAPNDYVKILAKVGEFNEK